MDEFAFLRDDYYIAPGIVQNLSRVDPGDLCNSVLRFFSPTGGERKEILEGNLCTQSSERCME